MTKVLKLISEAVVPKGTSPSSLIESTKTRSGKMYIEGIFAQADIVNGNNHVYPLDVMKEAVDTYMEEYVGRSMALGELNHPDHLEVDPKESCIVVENLEWDGANLYGRAKVLENLPNGKIVKELLDEGVALGVSTRGAGAMEEDKERKAGVIQPGFELIAIDVVSNPAAPEAFVNGVMESMSLIREGKGFRVVTEADVTPDVNILQMVLNEVRKHKS